MTTDKKKQPAKGAQTRKPRVKQGGEPARKTKSQRGTSGRKKTKKPKRGNSLKRFLLSIVMRQGEVAPWAIWTATCLVALAYISVVYFFFFRPYMDSKSEKELYFLRPQVHGVDISHYQGRINWDKLSQAAYKEYPINFVFMKATEGVDFVDHTFQQNFASARDFGLVRGAYHFYQPAVSAELQAESFIRQVQLEPGDLPPVLDVEVLGKGGIAELQRGAKIWLKRVEEHYGVKPIIYASYSFKKDYLDDEFFDDYPYWIAHYHVDSLRYKGPWKFWQHSDMGKIDGVNGHVDLDIFNGNLEELMQLTIR